MTKEAQAHLNMTKTRFTSVYCVSSSLLLNGILNNVLPVTKDDNVS